MLLRELQRLVKDLEELKKHIKGQDEHEAKERLDLAVGVVKECIKQVIS